MKGGKIYRILFTGTALIVGLMLLIDQRLHQNEKKLLFQSMAAANVVYGEKIDQLFLSANELSIAEKKAFINIYLKTPQNLPEADKNIIKDQRDALYYSILQQRINRTTSKPQEDFSVRPVPK